MAQHSPAPLKIARDILTARNKIPAAITLDHAGTICQIRNARRRRDLLE